MKRKTFIQLGKTGDILNMLPLAKQAFDDDGVKPLIMVASEFIDVMDGVSYAEPLEWRGSYEGVKEAISTLDKTRHQVIVSQIFGTIGERDSECWNFCRESWFAAGCHIQWGSLALTIDLRDKAREAELVKRVPAEGAILLFLQGQSSQFPHAELVLQAILSQAKLRGRKVIDCSDLKAHRIYDLLGLIERAAQVVTVDSAVLHLCHAAPNVPVTALINGQYWLGSAWRPQQHHRFFYDQIPEKLPELLGAIFGESSPRIMHLISDRRIPDVTTGRRMIFALSTARGQNWYQRVYNGSGIYLPRVSDIINFGASFCEDRDIIVFANDDTCFAPGLSGEIFDTVSRHGASYAFRWNFGRIENPIPSEGCMKQGKWDFGCDAFFFSKKWWLDHRSEFPSMYFGRTHWDVVMRQLIKRHGGVELHHAIYHEAHDSPWKKDLHSPENLHNLKAWREWSNKTGYPFDDFTYWK